MNRAADRPPILSFLLLFSGLLTMALCLAALSQSLTAETAVAADAVDPGQTPSALDKRGAELDPQLEAARRLRP